MRPHDDDASLQSALDDALAVCREKVVEYRAGLLDEAELHRELRRAGLVRRGDDVWLLDVDTEQWHHWVRQDLPGRSEEVSPWDDG